MATSAQAPLRPDQAVAAALETLKCDPHRAEAWETAARIFMQHGKWKEARGLLETALGFLPEHPLLPIYHALALMETGHEGEAFIRVNDILRRAPENPHALFAKGEILRHAGYYDVARRYYMAAGKIEGLRKTAAFGMAVADFIAGDYTNALSELARLEDNAPDAPQLPLWNGKLDPALHLMLYGSQGFGDILMFLRYIEAAKPLVGKLTLRVPHQLARLVRDTWPDLPLYATRDAGDTRQITLPECVTFEMPQDAGARCPLIQLPVFTGNTFDARAKAVPYLRADAGKVRAMKERIAHLPKPHIGIVWAGSPRHQADHVRSVPLDMLQPVLKAAKPHLVSLQMQPHREEGVKAGLFDAAPFIEDFSDTAALIGALDLLVTVDTAPAHLAGSLGVPVWTMIPFTHMDWRWLLSREDTIWYPSMRLFRQPAPREWGEVARNIAAELQKFVAGDRSVLSPPLWTGGFLSRHPRAFPLPGIGLEPGF